MKKYLFGMLAIVLAIGFSAHTEPKASPKNLDDLHWYRTNAAGTVLVSSLGQISEDEIEGLTGCDNTAVEYCARGYENPQSLGVAPTPSDGEFFDKEEQRK